VIKPDYFKEVLEISGFDNSAFFAKFLEFSHVLVLTSVCFCFDFPEFFLVLFNLFYSFC